MDPVFFSRLNLTDAFFQVPLHFDCLVMTTINIPFGLYSYEFFPPGLSITPANFWSVINLDIQRLVVEIYQKGSRSLPLKKTIQEENLHSLLQAFCEVNVANNSSKCF